MIDELQLIEQKSVCIFQSHHAKKIKHEASDSIYLKQIDQRA